VRHRDLVPLELQELLQVLGRIDVVLDDEHAMAGSGSGLVGLLHSLGLAQVER
jgi:hypothetical protein